MAAVWLVVPDVPVTVTFAAPAVATDDAVSVSVEEALPLAGGVTEDGANDAVTPAGRPLAERLTADEKPAMLVTVTVLVPLPPCAIVSDEGLAPTEKSGVAVPPQLANLKEPTRVDQLKVPFALTYSVVYQNVQSSEGSTVIAL